MTHFYLRTLCNCFPPFNLRSDSPGISRQRANCGCSALLSHLHFKSLIHVRAGPSGSAVCTCTLQPSALRNISQSSTPICITTGQCLHCSFLLTISSLNDAKCPPFKLDFSSKVQSGAGLNGPKRCSGLGGRGFLEIWESFRGMGGWGGRCRSTPAQVLID